MEANSFNMQAMAIESSTMNSSADIRGFKKPDKALPCPRCNSLATKFCYYNNYNVNQPRHFCKGCQRYWTAGGTLSNVAVGAGRRKRKHSLLESESVTEVSSVELPHAQEFSPTRRVPTNSGSIRSSSPAKASNGVCSGTIDLPQGKSPLLQSNASPFDVSGNLSSLNVPGSVSSELICAKQSLISQQISGSPRSSHNNREQASVFHEFMQLKHPAALSNENAGRYNLQEHVYSDVANSKLESSNVHVPLQRHEYGDLGSKLVLAMPSERQVSSESGCASSVTTQTWSVDVCTNDGKSDTMDSEITKAVENSDNGGFPANESSHSPSIMSCNVAVSECGQAVSRFSQCDSGGAATLAPAPLLWKAPLENPSFGSSWGMLPMPLSGGPAAERAPLWVPWGPSASALDAAKAALIPKVGELLKPQSEPIQKFLTAPDRDFLQKSGIEPNAPSQMRVWVPKTLNIKDVDEAARSSIWSTLGIGDRQGSLVSEQTKEAFQCQAKEIGIEAVQTQYANPAALSHSVTFQESS